MHTIGLLRGLHEKLYLACVVLRLAHNRHLMNGDLKHQVTLNVHFMHHELDTQSALHTGCPS